MREPWEKTQKHWVEWLLVMQTLPSLCILGHKERMDLEESLSHSGLRVDQTFLPSKALLCPSAMCFLVVCCSSFGVQKLRCDFFPFSKFCFLSLLFLFILWKCHTSMRCHIHPALFLQDPYDPFARLTHSFILLLWNVELVWCRPGRDSCHGFICATVMSCSETAFLYLLPILWLLHPFCPIFRDVPGGEAGGVEAHLWGALRFLFILSPLDRH